MQAVGEIELVTTHLFVSCLEGCGLRDRCAFQHEFQTFCAALGVRTSVASECEGTQREETEPTDEADQTTSEDQRKQPTDEAPTREASTSAVKPPTTPKKTDKTATTTDESAEKDLTDRQKTDEKPTDSAEPATSGQQSDLCSKSEDYKNVALDFCFSFIYGELSDPKCSKVSTFDLN